MSAVERFRDLVASQLGLRLDETGPLAEVLARRARAASLADEAYLARLAQGAGAEERRALARELTIGETYFFRNPDQFAALEALARAPRDAPGPLRVLSAGCASGEEPYTIAMVLAGVLPPGAFSIRAVDLDAGALARAVRARYSEWSLRETPGPARERFFRRDGASFVLQRSVRGLVSFEERNLAAEDAELWAPGAYDVVFCRNVVMYFTAEHARALAARVHGALRPDGHLFVGHAETLRGVSPAFDLLHTHGTFYYRRRAQTPARTPAHPPSVGWPAAIESTAVRVDALLRQAASPAPAAAAAPPVASRDALASLVDRERFADALALLDADAEAAEGDDRLLRAALLAQSARFAEAEEACRALLSEDARSAGAHYLLALCRAHTGDAGGARVHDRMAAHLDPSFAMPRLHLGLLARRAGDRDGAARELAEAIALLRREEPERLRLFGGGFGREALTRLCRAELAACGVSA